MRSGRDILYGDLRYLLNSQHDTQVHTHTPTQTLLEELSEDKMLHHLPGPV